MLYELLAEWKEILFGAFGAFLLCSFAVAVAVIAEKRHKFPPLPMWREEGENYVLGYMDRIGFECELGAALGGNRVYPSVEDCKENHKCWPSCGIVEVKVEATRIVERGTLEEELEEGARGSDGEQRDFNPEGESSTLSAPSKRKQEMEELTFRKCHKHNVQHPSAASCPLCCPAVIFHGPGHQSKTRCELEPPHEVHQSTSTGRLLEWVGTKGCTDYFDECKPV